MKQFLYDYMANPDGDTAVPWASQGGAGFQPARRVGPPSVGRQECLPHPLGENQTNERKPL